MYTAAEHAILEELAVEVARSTAIEHDPDVVVTVCRNDYIDRLEFFFGKYVPRPVVTRICSQLTELGLWLPESVRWKVMNEDVYAKHSTFVRLSPTLRAA